MPNLGRKNYSDEELIELFRDFDVIFTQNKTDTDYRLSKDFQVQSEFLIKDIKEIQRRLEKNAGDKYLYYVCEHIFNIMNWIKLIEEDAISNFSNIWEGFFDEHFGDKNLLQSLYDSCFEKWVSQKNGQHQIGQNFYNIIEGRLFYHNRFGKWFEVNSRAAFDFKPDLTLVKNKGLIKQLNGDYRETWYDNLLSLWESQEYRGELSDNFLKFGSKESSPEQYFDFTVTYIKELLKNPVSISELERWNGSIIADLEDIVKIVAFVLNITKKRQRDDSHTVYLLRDCLMFYESQQILDLINSETTSSDQIMIGRKLLTHESRRWGYYIVTLEALYTAHQRYPVNFAKFYNEYARLMNLFVSLNPNFEKVVSELADYIKNHIQTGKKRIVVFDIGFQGSIALLTKYIIDYHIAPTRLGGKIKTDINVGVGAVWSKKLYGKKYEGYYFPFLYHLQLIRRSNDLYHYKEGSLKNGKIGVVMGKAEDQKRAAVELVTLVMLAMLGKTENRNGGLRYVKSR